MSADLRFSGAQGAAADRPTWFEIARTLHLLPVAVQYSIATVLVVLTLVFTWAFARDGHGYHFVFFMPVVLLTSTVLRQGNGPWTVALSAIVIKAFFIAPRFSPLFADAHDFLAVMVFVASGIVTALMGGELHKAFFRLSDANERIAASEQEKELLLHELAHRFRNDLSNLTAIFHLRAKKVSDPLARSELMMASERIYVLGRVHQRLTHYTDMTDVDVHVFLADLCTDLRVSMIGGRPITLELHAEPAKLPFPSAMTLGLIVNELVQNALKYAFPGDRPGHVRVRFFPNGAEYHLTVADDGVGNANPSPTSSGLGQRLIESFVKQLHGTYEVKIDGGRAVEVKFPASPRS